ncbi:MAG: DoxX family protein [Candidatus Kapabacteria bacterium]|nr:DoxX family protein [Candidatus Kapabacteria bacterium]
MLTGNIARILFSVPFLAFGAMHLMSGDQMAGMVPIPGGVVWIYITGLCEIAAAVSIYTRKKTYLAMMLLSLLLLIYVVSIHIPGVMNEATRMMSVSGLLKDIGLMGGALMLAGMSDKNS